MAEAWCVACFSKDVEVLGGGRMRRCRACGSEMEKVHEGNAAGQGEGWKITRRGRAAAGTAVAEVRDTGAVASRQFTLSPGAAVNVDVLVDDFVGCPAACERVSAAIKAVWARASLRQRRAISDALAGSLLVRIEPCLQNDQVATASYLGNYITFDPGVASLAAPTASGRDPDGLAHLVAHEIGHLLDRRKRGKGRIGLVAEASADGFSEALGWARREFQKL